VLDFHFLTLSAIEPCEYCSSIEQVFEGGGVKLPMEGGLENTLHEQPKRPVNPASSPTPDTCLSNSV
jgi:hypothetical protein